MDVDKAQAGIARRLVSHRPEMDWAVGDGSARVVVGGHSDAHSAGGCSTRGVVGGVRDDVRGWSRHGSDPGDRSSLVRNPTIRVVSAGFVIAVGLGYLIVAQNDPSFAQAIALGYIALVLTIALVTSRWL